MIKKYEVYLKIDNDFSPSPGIEVVSSLDPGFYKVDFDMRNKIVTFVRSKSTHDELVDLPEQSMNLLTQTSTPFYQKNASQDLKK